MNEQTSNISNIDGRRKKRPGLEEQKNSVRQAAIALFSKHGPKQVSISQICDQADITRPTFYRCFTDKDALLEDLYETSINYSVGEILLKHAGSSDHEGKWLKAALEDVYDAIFEQPELAQLLFREASDPQSPAYQVINQAFEQIANQLLAGFQTSKPDTATKTWLKAVMAANQWIVQDAINKGLTPKTIREAKEACWLLASRLFR